MKTRKACNIKAYLWENQKHLLSVLFLTLLLVMSFSACGTGNTESGETATVSVSTESAVTTSESGISTEESGESGDAENSAAADACDAAAARQLSGADSRENAQTDTPTCTFSINCATILDNLDSLDSSKTDIVPEDGVIYAAQEVEFTAGESVFDLLARITKENKIHMEFTKTPAFNTNYVEGIANLYEFDCGELSGWTYKVNGEVVGYGSSNAIIEDGDVIEWVYTCDQGRDVGGPEVE